MAHAVNVFVQARMSSQRFPGKVLAPFRGRAMILHVLANIQQALPSAPVIVATSTHESDDPLALYLGYCGATVFRGPLDDVFERFRLCVEAHPCDWILRVSADSPLLDTSILRGVASHANQASYDLVTTVYPRTFPKGQNAELIRVRSLLGVDPKELSPGDREHVTPFYYQHPQRFRILNVESSDPDLAKLSMAVDSVEDLRGLEALSDSELLALQRRISVTA